MDTYKRHICFHYYRVVLEEERDGQWEILNDFNMADWLAKISVKDMLKKEVQLNDCKACVERVEIEDKEDIYSIRFHKLRDTNVPSKFKNGHEAEIIPLDEDEYIAEEMNILYDRSKGVCMVQQNRMSLGTARLSEWMTKECADNQRVVFLPIYNYEPTQRFKGKQIRSIDVTFANMEQDTGNRAFSDIICGMRRFKGCKGHFSVSVGHSRYKELDNMATLDLIEQLRENRESFSGAKVKLRDDDKGRIEIVDVFDEALHDFIEFDIVAKQGISFEEERYQMLRQYKNRIPDITRLLSTV